MKKVILYGDDRTVETIVKENRVRVSRGLIKFAPCQSGKGAEPCDTKVAPAETPKEVVNTDSKEAVVEDAKTASRRKSTSRK